MSKTLKDQRMISNISPFHLKKIIWALFGSINYLLMSKYICEMYKEGFLWKTKLFFPKNQATDILLNVEKYVCT